MEAIKVVEEFERVIASYGRSNFVHKKGFIDLCDNLREKREDDKIKEVKNVEI